MALLSVTDRDAGAIDDSDVLAGITICEIAVENFNMGICFDVLF